MFSNLFENSVLSIELTNFCNCSCVMCTQSQMKGHARGFLSSEIFDKLLKEIVDNDLCFDKLIPFGLGESTLHPEFFDFMEEIFKINRTKRYFKSIDIHTNGINMSDELIKLFAEGGGGLSTLSFSIDAASEQTYFNIRRNRNFNNMIKNIQNVIRKRKNPQDPKIILQFIVMEENREEAPLFLNFWKDFLNQNRLDFQVNYDWNPPMIKDTIFFKRLNPVKHEEISKAEKIHYNVVENLGLIEKKTENSDRAVESREYRGEKRRYPCSGPFKYVMVNWEGEVTVCCIDTLRELSLGNLKNNTLQELWWSKKNHEYRLAHISGDISSMDKCLKCNNLDSPEISKKEIEKYLKKFGFKDYMKYLGDL
ncbi:MAG: radical SAM protein [Candidatus Muiribacteriota bacterium]